MCLGPLASAVVKVAFLQDTQFVRVLADSAAGPSSALRYKVYEDKEANCAAVPEGPRVFPNALAANSYYVLVSNTSTGADLNFVVEVQPVESQ